MRQLCGIFFIALLLSACSQGYKFSLPETTNNFGQAIKYNNKVDLLFIVDNSSSMGQHQNDLSKSIPTMVSTLSALKLDLHIAVISTSMGGASPDGGQFLGSPRYLTGQDANLSSVLSNRILLGEAGSNLERGLLSLETVLAPSYLNGQGVGFLRSDALLAVIALSDEDDKSGSDATYYMNLLDGIKKPFENGARSWVLNFVGVLSLTAQCRTFNDYSEPGVVYMNLADLSGGRKESLCSNDLSGAVTNIHGRIVEILTDYRLNKKPVLDSIRVYINNVLVSQSTTNGWEYISTSNAIRFHGSAIPAADASVKVDFKPAEAN